MKSYVYLHLVCILISLALRVFGTYLFMESKLGRSIRHQVLHLKSLLVRKKIVLNTLHGMLLNQVTKKLFLPLSFPRVTLLSGLSVPLFITVILLGPFSLFAQLRLFIQDLKIFFNKNSMGIDSKIQKLSLIVSGIEDEIGNENKSYAENLYSYFLSVCGVDFSLRKEEFIKFLDATQAAKPAQVRSKEDAVLVIEKYIQDFFMEKRSESLTFEEINSIRKSANYAYALKLTPKSIDVFLNNFQTIGTGEIQYLEIALLGLVKEKV